MLPVVVIITLGKDGSAMKKIFLTTTIAICLLMINTGSAAEKEFTNSIGMKFVRIEAGSFQMGSVEGGDFDEKTLRMLFMCNVIGFYRTSSAGTSYI